MDPRDREKIREMRLLQAALIALCLTVAAVFGWWWGDAYGVASGLLAGFTIVAVFGMGVVWSVCDVIVDDRRRRAELGPPVYSP